jgi:hypothetical protein
VLLGGGLVEVHVGSGIWKTGVGSRRMRHAPSRASRSAFAPSRLSRMGRLLSSCLCWHHRTRRSGDFASHPPGWRRSRAAAGPSAANVDRLLTRRVVLDREVRIPDRPNDAHVRRHRRRRNDQHIRAVRPDHRPDRAVIANRLFSLGRPPTEADVVVLHTRQYRRPLPGSRSQNSPPRGGKCDVPGSAAGRQKKTASRSCRARLFDAFPKRQII